jgi:hypothetical protein
MNQGTDCFLWVHKFLPPQEKGEASETPKRHYLLRLTAKVMEVWCGIWSASLPVEPQGPCCLPHSPFLMVSFEEITQAMSRCALEVTQSCQKTQGAGGERD